MDDYEIKLAEWRGGVIKALEILDKNDDVLFGKVNDINTKFGKQCVEIKELKIKLENLAHDVGEIEEWRDFVNQEKQKMRLIFIGAFLSFLAQVTILIITLLLRQ